MRKFANFFALSDVLKAGSDSDRDWSASVLACVHMILACQEMLLRLR